MRIRRLASSVSALFVDVLQFELVDDAPLLTNTGVSSVTTRDASPHDCSCAGQNEERPGWGRCCARRRPRVSYGSTSRGRISPIVLDVATIGGTRMDEARRTSIELDRGTIVTRNEVNGWFVAYALLGGAVLIFAAIVMSAN